MDISEIMKMKGLAEVVDFIKSNDDFTVVYHIDADGICSAAIACSMLKRLGKKYIFTGMKQLDRGRAEQIRKLGNNFIFVDMGSGQIKVLEEVLKDRKFCVIDHHKPPEGAEKIAVPQFNTHFCGYDGASDISGAGMTYLVAKAIDEKNEDLSGIAIVGAVGDMQYTNNGVSSLNRKILEDAEKAGMIKAMRDLLLFGRHSRALTQFLSYCSDPFLPGLTANEDACIQFLNELKIPLKKKDKWTRYVDLTADEKTQLTSGLYVYGKQQNLSERVLENLVGEVYELIHEPEGTELRDAKEYATLLNACGRHDKGEIGVAVCMGDRDKHLKKAQNLLQKHRRMLRDGIEWAQVHSVKEMSSLYVLDAGKEIEDTLIGVVAGMLYSAGVIKHDKPVIAIAVDDEGKVKISGRATWPLVNKGLHLGIAMREAGGTMDEEAAGGHSIAAGARISPEKKDAFVEKLNEIVGKQLKG